MNSFIFTARRCSLFLALKLICMHANIKCHSVCSDMTLPNKEDVKKPPKQ